MYKLSLDETHNPGREQIKLGNSTTRKHSPTYSQNPLHERKHLVSETLRLNYGDKRGF
jgi:hypothetical protein